LEGFVCFIDQGGGALGARLICAGMSVGMRFGLELQKFTFQGLKIVGDGACGRWAGGEGLGEEVVMSWGFGGGLGWRGGGGGLMAQLEVLG